MVAVIKVGSSIRRAFHYNENKVKEGVAELLLAENYPMDLDKMQEFQRLNMLLRTAETNPNVRANSVHISLNFAKEDELTNEKLMQIATEYMQSIGFENQPFLVYRHYDAGHDHVHIVSVKVGLDGQRIETQNIGKELSEQARKHIETKYGLIPAERQKDKQISINKADPVKVKYGKVETKRAIGNVLDEVLNAYKFTSFPELNAVLNLYNVHAEKGKEGSRLFQFGGLQYHVLNADGDSVGIPIKASLFHDRPTLKKLEKLFVKNDVARQQHKKRLQTTISFMVKSKRPKSLQELKELLHREGIRLIPRISKDGTIHGITYVDLKTKCVFNGSALGKQFSAKAMLESIHLKNDTGIPGAIISAYRPTFTEPKPIGQIDNPGGHFDSNQQNSNSEKSIMELLTQYEFAASSVPYEWRKKKRKKRRKIG